MVPSPMRPALLAPQQYATPLVVTAHEPAGWRLVDATLARPGTSTGVSEVVVSPVPS